MAEVEIYTTMFCGYCYRAKKLLETKGVAYREIPLETTANARQELQQRAPGSRTVPQIFIAGAHVGGCDDLYALERDGKLDGMLNAA